MKAKLISILVTLLLGYVIPLIPKIELLGTIQILFLAALTIILIVTQPPFIVRDVRENDQRDKYSVWVIAGAIAITHISIILEWAYFQQNFLDFRIDAQTLIGLALIIVGTILRISSSSTLGNFFTATVRTLNDQNIITNGVYKYVRHPGYLALYMVMAGSAVFMHTYFSIFFALVVMFLAFNHRMKFEEIAMVEDFGEEYRAYQKNTKKLIPFIY